MKTKLRELRKAENLTLKQVADKLSISLQVLSYYEKEEGVSIDYILCRDNASSTPRYFTEDPTLKAILDIYETLSPVQCEQWLAIAEILKSENR